MPVRRPSEQKLTKDGEFYYWTIRELSDRSLCVYHLGCQKIGSCFVLRVVEFTACSLSSSVCTINVFDPRNVGGVYKYPICCLLATPHPLPPSTSPPPSCSYRQSPARKPLPVLHVPIFVSSHT